MRVSPSLLCGLLLMCFPAMARAATPAQDPFPAVDDFPELQKVLAESFFSEPSRLATVTDGRLYSDVGFERYAKRVYSAGDFGDISITVVTLMDSRAAYSLLTLRTDSGTRNGPPGDAFAADSSRVAFFQGRRWIQITGAKAPADLLRRLAVSVSDRLGPHDQKPPSLIRHFPGTGYDASSLKYFPGLKSFETYSGTQALKDLRLEFDAEIARARYALDNTTGILTLLNFPTPEVGEEYFNEFSTAHRGIESKDKTYLKRSGPLVAVLTGRMNPGEADTILGAISHSYSIRWIFEKPQKKGVTWGIPVRILHTVVKSILFVVLLSVIAIIAGAGFAFLRFAKKRRESKEAADGLGQTNSNWLRLR